MADDNRFAGISEQLDDAVADDDHRPDDDEAPAETDASAATDQTESGTAGDAGDDTEDGPAFSFDATAQMSIYPRTETATNTLDDIEFEVEGILRREHEIRDLAGRELHDAMIQLAAAHPEEVAELIVQLRDDST